ncbi:MAG: hypothetical protein MK198_07300 [Gracilimonas sp.]|uniref:hypothetical protein n=1 Tax=Gracilimonas sp. TaxID=1974203 RepID=UPI003753654A|nr:hypothetical protein [Gracilimonas sp.]
MQIHEIFTEAFQEVEKSNLPEEFRLKAFEKAIDLISSQNYSHSAHPPSGTSKSLPALIEDSESSEISQIANRLGLSSQIIEEIYYIDDDELKIIIGTGSLDSSTAGATKELALLLAGGRQLSGIEEWTSANDIRDVCDYFGKYDQPNFAKTIKSMEDIFSLMGNGQKRQVKLKRPGIERLKELIKDIANIES